MEKIIEDAIEFADFRKSLSVQKKFLKEQLDADLTFGFNGGIFKISPILILFCEYLVSKNKLTNVPFIDINNNPILIPNVLEFQNIISEKYFDCIYRYIDEQTEINKLRDKKLLKSYLEK